MASAAYLSAVSIMLAAYGFFYGIYRDPIENGLKIDTPNPGDAGLEQQVKTLARARSAALLLGIVPLIVWLIFLGPVIEEIEAAFEVSFALSHYSAIDVAFVAAASAWIVIAFILLRQAKKLGRELKRFQEIEKKREELPGNT